MDIYLRLISEYDAENLLKMRNNKDLWHYTMYQYNENITLINVKKWITTVSLDPSRINFAIISNDCNNLFLGYCTLTSIDYEMRNCELNIVIDSSYHNKGIGKKTIAILIDFCKYIVKINKIYLYVHRENICAIRLYENIGFQIDYDKISSKNINFIYGEKII